MLRRRQWHPTPVLLPGKSHGWRSLEGCSPWGCWGSDTTEQLHFHFSLSCIGEENGNPLQCSCLENPRGGRAWWAAICGVAQSRTRLKWLSKQAIMLQWIWEPIYIFKLVFSFSSDKCPKVELLDHVIALFLIFHRTSISFSIVLTPIYIPTNSEQAFPFSHIFTRTCYFLFFGNSLSDKYEVISHCSFNLHFPDD